MDGSEEGLQDEKGKVGEAVNCKIGKHSNIPDSYFDARQLTLGIKTELEHTGNRMIAKNIAKDHLMENKFYYSKLLKAGL